MKFPEEPKISDEARDLICRLLCDVDSRLGTRGVEEIKVRLLKRICRDIFLIILDVIVIYFVHVLVASVVQRHPMG